MLNNKSEIPTNNSRREGGQAGTCRNNCVNFCSALRETFRNDESPERKNLDRIMMNRAWVIHMISMVYRIYKLAMEDTLWDQYEDEKLDFQTAAKEFQ